MACMGRANHDRRRNALPASSSCRPDMSVSSTASRSRKPRGLDSHRPWRWTGDGIGMAANSPTLPSGREQSRRLIRCLALTTHDHVPLLARLPALSRHLVAEQDFQPSRRDVTIGGCRPASVPSPGLRLCPPWAVPDSQRGSRRTARITGAGAVSDSVGRHRQRRCVIKRPGTWIQEAGHFIQKRQFRGLHSAYVQR